MAYSHYDFPGLWFQIHGQVTSLNDKLEEEKLDKSQLREVVTSIFIASTQRGIVRPWTYSKFQAEIMKMIEPVARRTKQEAIFNAVQDIVKDGRKKEEVTA